MGLRPGTLLGPYEVVAPLGAGGMGEVYRARDTRLGRDVAVKVLPAQAASDPDRRRRFEREARAVAALSHPHICTVFDVGLEPGEPGSPAYLVMELLEGPTLADRLSRGPLAVATALKIGIEIAGALDKAHRAGVVHRDVKPGNIVLTKGGAKLLDFGLARLRPHTPVSGDGTAATGDLTHDGALTEAGQVVGTYPYLAPEQIEGRPVDARADLFALGVVLHEMVAGTRPFPGHDRASVWKAILTAPPASLAALAPGTPPSLDRVVRQCLVKDPDERVQSAHDLGLALRSIAEDVGSAREGGTRVAEGGRSPGRRWWLATAALAVLAAAAAGLGSRLTTDGGRRSPPTFTQLTFRRGTVDSARFTADGGSVVYGALWDGGPPEIFTRRLDSPDPIPLGVPPARLLSVSSAGEAAILLMPPEEHSGFTTGRLARVPLSGGTARPVLDDVLSADWSPDGRELAVVRSVDGRYAVEYPIGRSLLYPCLHCEPGMQIRVSPRGDSVAIDTSRGLVVIDLAGKAQDLDVGGNAIKGFAWFPDGESLLATAGLSNSRTTLNRVTRGGERTALYSQPGVLYLQDLGRDGRLLAHHGLERWGGLAKPPGAADEREVAVSAWSIVAGLSADGGQVLLHDTQSSPRLDGEMSGDRALLVPTQGGAPLRLGDGAAAGLSADGGSVLISRLDRSRFEVTGFELAPTGAGEPIPVPTAGLTPEFYFRPGTETAWHVAVDGVGFWASEPGRGRRSYYVSLPGGRPRAVTPEGVLAVRGSLSDGQVLGWSPDGALASYPVAGGDPRPQSVRVPTGAYDYPVRVSGDRRFLFVREGSVPARISRIELATGRKTAWLTLRPRDPAGNANIFGIALTPDGKGYAYTYGQYLQDLFLVEGLLQ